MDVQISGIHIMLVLLFVMKNGVMAKWFLMKSMKEEDRKCLPFIDSLKAGRKCMTLERVYIECQAFIIFSVLTNFHLNHYSLGQDITIGALNLTRLAGSLLDIQNLALLLLQQKLEKILQAIATALKKNQIEKWYWKLAFCIIIYWFNILKSDQK